MRSMNIQVAKLTPEVIKRQGQHILTCVQLPEWVAPNVQHWPAFDLFYTPFQLPHFQSGDILFFVSRFSIDAFFHSLSPEQKAYLLSLKLVWAAPGKSSTAYLAQHLHSSSFQGTLLPSSSQESGFGFYLQLKEKGIPIAQLFVLRAETGNQYWIDGLKKEGWVVQCVKVYERRAKNYEEDMKNLVQNISSEHIIWHWFSSEAVRLFIEQFKRINALEYFYDSWHICGHERIAQTLKAELL